MRILQVVSSPSKSDAGWNSWAKAGGKTCLHALERLISEGIEPLGTKETNSVLEKLAAVFQTAAKPRKGDGPSTAESGRETSHSSSDHFEIPYRLLIEQIPAVVFLAFLDRSISEAYVSPHIEHVLGFSQEEWLNDPVLWYRQLHPDDRERWSREAADFLVSTDPLRSVYRVMARGGQLVWFHCEVKIVRRDNGEPWLVHGVAFDITELKQAQEALQRVNDELARDVAERERLEQQLIHSQKMESIGTLAAGIAHDFNNLLTIIRAYAVEIINDVGHPKELERDVSAIQTAADRGASLVQQLLTFAQKKSTEPSQLDVNHTIDELVGMARGTFPKTIRFNVELDPSILPIWGDRNQLYQALLNILVNARDAMPDGGELWVRTRTVPKNDLAEKVSVARKDSYVGISITDTGCGMDERTRSRIFEPFFTTKERDKGTGLGLATVYGIVKSHQGFIDIESKASRGTSFHLYFPVQPVEKKSS